MPDEISLTAAFDRIAGTFEGAGEIWTEEAEVAGQVIAERLTARLKEPGRDPAEPINWATDKQRKAFYATDGFEGGIPHVQSGEVAASWQQYVKVTSRAIEAGATSDNVGAFFTRDMHDQSPIFAGYYQTTGDILTEEEGFIANTLEEMAARIVERMAGDISHYAPRSLGRQEVGPMIERYSQLVNQ